VMLSWAWAWLTNNRHARLITGPSVGKPGESKLIASPPVAAAKAQRPD
jgi:hypothetical protein